MSTFAERMLGASKFDVHTYEEVEADTSATGQALGVVVLSSIAAGIGWAGQGAPGIVAAVLGSLIGWFLWAAVIYVVGTKLLPEPQTRSDIGELLRTTGFAASPGVLRILGLVPMLTLLINFVVGIWMLGTFVVAVRQALDYRSTGRAVLVCLIGWLFFVVLQVFLFLVLFRSTPAGP